MNQTAAAGGGLSVCVILKNKKASNKKFENVGWKIPLVLY